VVCAGAVVVVEPAGWAVLDVVVELEVELPLPLLPLLPVVVVVVGGATKVPVSPVIVAGLEPGDDERLVQLRAAFQLWTAAAAG
jgi:hypothetical protein